MFAVVLVQTNANATERERDTGCIDIETFHFYQSHPNDGVT